MSRRRSTAIFSKSGFGAASFAVALLGLAAPAVADTFSFGDYFFPGDMEGDGFSSFTDQNTSYSVDGPGAGFQFFSQGEPGPYPWAGQFRQGVLVLYDDDAVGAVTIAFGAPVDSIDGLAAQPLAPGAYAATLTAFAGATVLGTSTYSSVNGPGPQGTIPYFSFASPGITSIEISTTNDSQGIGIGGGAGIPEPSAWALMVAGFSALGGALRRRGRRAGTA
jgi:hypothetical protein